MKQYAQFKGIYTFMFISKECPTNIKSKCLNVVRQKVATSTIWKYITGKSQNMAFSVVDRLCDKIEGKGHCVYMDRWFSSPKIFDPLWACKTKAAGTVMSNGKVMPKQAFPREIKQVKKYHANRITSWPSSGMTSMMLFS
jgi:hypothetical protein